MQHQRRCAEVDWEVMLFRTWMVLLRCALCLTILRTIMMTFGQRRLSRHKLQASNQTKSELISPHGPKGQANNAYGWL